MLAAALVTQDFEYDKPPYGYVEIAGFAQKNYYQEAVFRLKAIVRTLRSLYGGKKSDYRIFCNSRDIDEKALAVSCGLGALGRNGLVIIPGIGTRAVLAALSLPFRLKQAPPYKNFSLCSGCGICVTSCPTGALDGTGRLKRELCIQWYLSGNGEFDIGKAPSIVRKNWGGRLYGCEECQRHCPHNKTPLPPRAAVTRGALPRFIRAEELIAQDDAALKDRFRGTALGLSWITPDLLRRNALGTR